jgi:hypothetical protein
VRFDAASAISQTQISKPILDPPSRNAYVSTQPLNRVFHTYRSLQT